MKTKITLALLLAVAAPGAILPRAAAADVSLGAFGSFLDTEDLGEAWGGGLRLKYDLIEHIGFDLRAGFTRIDDASLNIFPLEGNLFFQFPIANRILPYGGFGVGYYVFDGSALDLEDRVGYGPLAGLELRLTQSFAIFGEARWLFLDPKIQSPSGLGSAKLGGFGINAGLMVLF
jgi:hypothetical protein